MATTAVSAFHYVQAFSCLAEHCEDTCCQGNWRIEAGPRAATLYRDKHPELLELIDIDSSGYRMKNVDSHCIALTAGRCRIHASAGESALPDTCGNYPRMYRHINGNTLKSATMGCPEITRLVLFGEQPFQLVQAHEDDQFLSGFTRQRLPGLTTEHWASVVGLLIEFGQSQAYSVKQILLRLHDLANDLSSIPQAEWAGQLPQLIAQQSLQTPPEAVSVAPLLSVLWTILNAADVPQTLRERVTLMITAEPATPPMQPGLVVKPAYRDMVNGAAGAALEPLLKTYLCAEMTRTGFPFISTSSAGKDYGQNLVEWASTLLIRTLALRYLLLAHCDIALQQVPDREQTVALVYRFCRAANHAPATLPEIELREQISALGGGYLRGIVEVA